MPIAVRSERFSWVDTPLFGVCYNEVRCCHYVFGPFNPEAEFRRGRGDGLLNRLLGPFHFPARLKRSGWAGSHTQLVWNTKARDRPPPLSPPAALPQRGA